MIVLPLALLRPARCEDCGRRHYTLIFAEGLPADAEKDKSRRIRTKKTEEQATEDQE